MTISLENITPELLEKIIANEIIYEINKGDDKSPEEINKINRMFILYKNKNFKNAEVYKLYSRFEREYKTGTLSREF